MVDGLLGEDAAGRSPRKLKSKGSNGEKEFRARTKSGSPVLLATSLTATGSLSGPRPTRTL